MTRALYPDPAFFAFEVVKPSFRGLPCLLLSQSWHPSRVEDVL